jgi:uncharacterized membrane protein
MSLAPLWAGGPIIASHALAALFAFGLGLIQLLLPKGTGLHRRLGYLWIVAMAFVALGSFGINSLRQLGPFSAIHLLSITTLFFLVRGVFHARAGRIPHHKYTMISLFCGALIIAGLFTLVPGRIMHKVLFQSSQDDTTPVRSPARP